MCMMDTYRRMKAASQTRVLAIALAIATLAVCVFACVNLVHENNFDVPTDGIGWIEAQGGLRANHVPSDSPGERAGIRKGDILIAIDDHPTPRIAPFEYVLYRDGIWAHSTYTILRPLPHKNNKTPSVAKFDVQVILEPTDRSINQVQRVIALVYLSIGLYVLFRRWTAPKSLHFFVFCLVSFVLYAFKYTGEFDPFDWMIYWSEILASALQPALILHFAVDFSGRDDADVQRRRLRWITGSLLYVPGLIVASLQVVAVQFWTAT